MHKQLSKALKRYNYLLNETNAAYHDLAQHLGQNDSSMIILYALCDGGGSCPLQDIRRNSGVSKQTINSALRKLEAQEIVYLKPGRTKNKTVCLTPKGQRLAEQTAEKIIDLENDIFFSWKKEDVEKYLELTGRYLTDFKKRSQEMMQKLPHPQNNIEKEQNTT